MLLLYCRNCGNYFEQFDDLVKHSIDKHNYAPGVECNSCKMGFVDDAKLKSHMEETHSSSDSNENVSKDFQCVLCNKIIMTTIGIERHKELYCEECEKELVLIFTWGFIIKIRIKSKKKHQFMIALVW